MRDFANDFSTETKEAVHRRVLDDEFLTAANAIHGNIARGSNTFPIRADFINRTSSLLKLLVVGAVTQTIKTTDEFNTLKYFFHLFP